MGGGGHRSLHYGFASGREDTCVGVREDTCVGVREDDIGRVPKDRSVRGADGRSAGVPKGGSVEARRTETPLPPRSEVCLRRKGEIARGLDKVGLQAGTQGGGGARVGADDQYSVVAGDGA